MQYVAVQPNITYTGVQMTYTPSICETENLYSTSALTNKPVLAEGGFQQKRQR